MVSIHMSSALTYSILLRYVTYIKETIRNFKQKAYKCIVSYPTYTNTATLTDEKLKRAEYRSYKTCGDTGKIGLLNVGLCMEIYVIFPSSTESTGPLCHISYSMHLITVAYEQDGKTLFNNRSHKCFLWRCLPTA